MKRFDFPLKTSSFLNEICFVLWWIKHFSSSENEIMHFKCIQSMNLERKVYSSSTRKGKNVLIAFSSTFFPFVEKKEEQCEWIKTLSFCESNAFYFNLSHCAQKERKMWESKKRDLLWFCCFQSGMNMNMDLSSIETGCVFLLYGSFFIITVPRGGEKKRRYFKKRQNG